MKWLAQVVQHSVANRALEDVVIIAKEVVELVAQENVSILAKTVVNIVVQEGVRMVAEIIVATLAHTIVHINASMVALAKQVMEQHSNVDFIKSLIE